MKITTNFIKQTKRHFSASGSILLPLALKWRLFTATLCALAASALPTIISSTAHAASLTISIPKNPLTVNVSANSNGGFSTASGTLKVSGDAAWGYTLTVKSNNSDNLNTLKSAENNTLSSITAPITPDATNSNFPTNAWGYKPSKKDSDGNTQYLPGPTSAETTIDNASSVTTDGTEYTIALAAKVDATQPAGTYSGSFTFTATANFVNYNITFNCGDVECSSQTGTSTETSVALKSQTRDKYQLLGYCTKNATNDKTCENAGGTLYQPGSHYPLTNKENNAELFAIWAPASMQNFNKYCDIMYEHQTLKLTDTRDGAKEQYKIRKLKDGQCWMIENLRLGDTYAIELSSADTDISGSWTLPKSTNTFSDTNNQAAHIVTDHKNNTEANTKEKYGVLYNWYAATAGTGAYTMTVTDAPGSVCPHGWRLMTGGGEEGEIIRLQNLYMDSTNVLYNSDGLNLVKSGFYSTNQYLSETTAGGYWTSRWEKDGRAYNYVINKSGIFSSFSDPSDPSLNYGHAVRCIARNEE